MTHVIVIERDARQIDSSSTQCVIEDAQITYVHNHVRIESHRVSRQQIGPRQNTTLIANSAQHHRSCGSGVCGVKLKSTNINGS